MVLSLDKDPGPTTRLVLCDWLMEHGEPPELPHLTDYLRYTGFAGKYPAPKKLSENPQNLAMGFGWWSRSETQPHAVIPQALKPGRVRPGRWKSTHWAWATRQAADEWLYRLFCLASPEVRESLLLEVTPK